MPLLVDSGPLVALLDADDDRHAECCQLLETYPSSLVIPVLCITEVTHIAAWQLGTRAQLRFLEAIDAGVFIVDRLFPEDFARMTELIATYRSLPLDAVDASVIATAERLGVGAIATLDQNRFGTVRPAHVEKLKLLP